MTSRNGMVTTEDVSAIRGLDSGATLETLRHRKMIAKERNRGQGKAVCWRTTQNFLDFFGLATLDDLYRGNKLERFFGPVYGINGIDDNRNDDAAGDL